MQTALHTNTMENGELIELNSSLTKNMEAQNAIVTKQQDTITKQLEAFTKQQESMEKLLERIDQLSAGNHDNPALQQPAVAQPIQPIQRSPEMIRREKFLLLHQNLLKSTKVKDYKISNQENIREWLRKFDLHVENIAMACDINLSTAPLTKDEYKTLIKGKLDSTVITEIEVKFKRQNLTWNNATEKQVRDTLLEQYGAKEPELSSLLKYFGANRPKKAPEMSVRNFFCTWFEQLPLCVKPANDAERIKCIDLLLRTIFYHALDDPYLQKELSNIPESEQTLDRFLEEAILAESRRHHYRDASEKGNVLDVTNNINVNKTEYSTSLPVRGRGNRRDNERWGGGRGGGWSRGQQQQHRSWPTDAQHHRQFNATGSNDANATDISKGSKPKRFKCQYCGIFGHTIDKCTKRLTSLKNTSTHKTLIEEDQQSDYDTYYDFDDTVNSFKLEIMSLHNGSHNPVNDESTSSVNVVTENIPFTSKDIVSVNVANAEELVPTRIQNIMGGVILNGNVKWKMELDTAACHSIMSYDLFKDIVSKSGDKPPLLKQCHVVMKMADGTLSMAVKGRTYISIARADMPEKTGIFEIIIVDGPHALLGRPTLQALWPEQYNDLAFIAKKSVDALCLLNANSASINHFVPEERKATAVDGAAATNTYSVSGNDSAKAGDTSTKSARCARPIPPFPTGDITQEEGEAFCWKLCEVFPELFDGGIGVFKNVEAEFHIIPGHEKYLKVMRPVKVAHGIEDLVDEQLDKIYETGTPVDGRGLKVASQCVPVVQKKKGKQNNKASVRLCGNYKRTINDHIEDEPYEFPTCNEQIDKLKGEYYSCLDITGAFNQVIVKPECRAILTLSTPRGFVEPTRMPFGVKTAPKIFQAGIDRLIHGMDGKAPVPSTACVVDDICTTGSTPQEHFQNLAELLSRLHAAGLKLNKDKCKFYKTQVKFLGKIIDRNGQHMDPASVDAIVNMPAPTDKHTLRSFLGHMSYIGRHVPDIRIARAPLDALLKKDVKFVWDDTHAKAFSNCKKLASNSATLAHFDVNLPLVLTTDASPVGLGACLSHRVIENGKTYLKPLSYASCSLKPAELNYAQIDREGLAVHWATNHYRQFLYCRHFELHTDCSALTRIFGSKNDLGGCAIGRLNRWAAALMEYDFHATHIRGASNKICDSLSRLPVPPKGELLATPPRQVGQTVSSEDLARSMSIKYVEMESADGIMDAVNCLAHLPDPKEATISICKIVGTSPTAVWDILPLSVKDVAKATREDRVYGKLISAIRSGEIDRNDPDMKPFNSLFDDLYVEQGVIFHGSRIVVPTKQQERLLDELHMTHMGIVKMKEVARAYFWWPLINKQIENIANSCEGCNRYRKRPAPAPLCPWPYARRAMERVHIDFCEFKGKQLLIMIDAYSKYIWTHIMNTDTTTMKTLLVLYGWFCERSGFPTTLVSDNGPQFTSKEFAEKMAKWGIKHILTPPYHPASNGLAEKAVDIVKTKLKKMECPASPIAMYVNLQAALRMYRATPHTSTGQTPYELISTAPVPVMFPHLQMTQQKIQETQRSTVPIDRIKHARKFQTGDCVLVYDTQARMNSHGIVNECKSNNSYIVTINDRNKHISGDNMRLISKNCFDNNVRVNKDNVPLTMDPNMESKDSSDDMDVYISDNDSVISDNDNLIFSDRNNSYEMVSNNVTNGVARKHYRPEHEKLNDGLSITFPASRTRSGRARNN